MKSLIFFLPATLVLALLITQQTLATLGVSNSASYVIPGIAICSLFLHQRSFVELLIMFVLLGICRLGEEQLAALYLSNDALVALIFAVLLLPTGLRLAGFDGLTRRHAS